MHHKAGVTITELVIVLIIVAVTGAILLPVFTHKTVRDPRLSCASNLKQIGLGMIEYIQDYDECLPPRQAQSAEREKLVSWRFIINPYVKNISLYQCPDNSANKFSDLEQDGFPRCYAVNSTAVARRGVGSPMSDAYAGKRKMDAITQPATVILIAETTAAFNDINVTFPAAFTSPFSATNNQGALYAGHDGYSNYLFADGHVKAWKPLQTWDFDGKNLWTSDNSAFLSAEKEAAEQVLNYAHVQYPPMHG